MVIRLLAQNIKADDKFHLDKNAADNVSDRIMLSLSIS